MNKALESGQQITAIIGNHSILIPFILLFVEEVAIPLPLPGELLIVYDGYLISAGGLSFVEVFLSLLIAMTGGALFLYLLAAKWGNVIVIKLGKYIHLNEQKLITLEKMFNRHGHWLIIFGRLIPGFRIPITIFSGMSQIKFGEFLRSLLLSNILVITVYLYLGKMLGTKGQIIMRQQYSFLFLLIIPVVIGLIFYLTSHHINRKKQSMEK